MSGSPRPAGAHPCPACGFEVFSGAPGSLESCPICGWVDDLVQLAQPDFAVGANAGVSLREAQSRALGLLPPEVRSAGAFARSSRWRPLSPSEDPSAEAFTLASPVCYLTDPDPDSFEPYWLRPPPTSGPDPGGAGGAVPEITMSLHAAFNRSGFSRFINSPRGRVFRLVAGTGFLVVGFVYRAHPLGVLSMAWSVFPLSAGAFDVCYISGVLGGPLSGAKIRGQREPGAG